MARIEGIAESLQRAVDSGDVPGVAAATADGEIFQDAAGVIAADSVLWIASMTKALTGAAAMQLIERGKLALDAPAADIVPEIASKGVLEGIDADGKVKTRPPRRPITLRHLLTHTSGMGYDTWNADIARYVQTKGVPKPASREVLGTPLLAEPGERWEYSISIDWAGLMVEAVSGMRLDRYMKENLFEPLDMRDTGFKIGPAQRPRKAAVHIRGEEGGFRRHRSRARPGAGSLHGRRRALFDGRRLFELHPDDPGRGRAERAARAEAADRAADVAERHGRRVVPSAQEPAAQPQHRYGFRRRHEVGSHLHDPSAGGAGRTLGGQPVLGRARQFLLLDRSGEEGHGRVGDAAPAVL